MKTISRYLNLITAQDLCLVLIVLQTAALIFCFV